MVLFSTNKWSSYKDATSLVDYSRIFKFLPEVGIFVTDAAGQLRQCPFNIYFNKYMLKGVFHKV